MYLIENADEICEKFKPSLEYPPWQAAPQAGSKGWSSSETRAKRECAEQGTGLRAAAKAVRANLLFCRGFPASRGNPAKAERLTGVAHGSLQILVKYEDGVF